MPVACQSRAPECPQAFGAQRLRGLRPSMVDNPSVTASPCHFLYTREALTAAAGMGGQSRPPLQAAAAGFEQPYFSL